jgi:hypothetical protein
MDAADRLSLLISALRLDMDAGRLDPDIGLALVHRCMGLITLVRIERITPAQAGAEYLIVDLARGSFRPLTDYERRH